MWASPRWIVKHVAKLLGAARGPMSPQQIADAIKKKGASKSENLATQVGQILAGDRVAARRLGRGQYVAAEKK